MKDNDVVNILWTGGWDSTFRVLDLLLSKAKVIQPFYIIDSDRLSTGAELRAMKNIKQRLFTLYPETENLFLPTKFKDLYDIKPNQHITSSFKIICETNLIGSQYEWLARFADDSGVEDLELCIHKDDKAHKALEPFVFQSSLRDDSFYRIKQDMQDTTEYSVFRYFKFPIFDYSKLDMELLSKNKGFYELMELTWFCFRPRANGTPCGTCSPCAYTIKEGLGRRIPFMGRLRFYLMQRKKALRNRCPKVYNFLRITKRTLSLR